MVDRILRNWPPAKAFNSIAIIAHMSTVYPANWESLQHCHALRYQLRSYLPEASESSFGGQHPIYQAIGRGR